MLLKVTTFITPVTPHSSFYQSSTDLHTGGFERFSPFMVTARLVFQSTFKKSCLKKLFFRKCTDNPKIPSSWITTLFYSSWHEAQHVKSRMAT